MSQGFESFPSLAARGLNITGRCILMTLLAILHPKAPVLIIQISALCWMSIISVLSTSIVWPNSTHALNMHSIDMNFSIDRSAILPTQVIAEALKRCLGSHWMTLIKDHICKRSRSNHAQCLIKFYHTASIYMSSSNGNPDAIFCEDISHVEACKLSKIPQRLVDVLIWTFDAQWVNRIIPYDQCHEGYVCKIWSYHHMIFSIFQRTIILEERDAWQF
jgi:hypothetical protein